MLSTHCSEELNCDGLINPNLSKITFLNQKLNASVEVSESNTANSDASIDIVAVP